MKQSTIEKMDSLNVKQMYESGRTTLEISKITYYSESAINKYLHINEVSMRKAKKRESLRDQPIIGTKYGQWTVISNEIKSGQKISPNSKSRSIYFKVQCNCGKIAWRMLSGLKNGKTSACKSCCKLNGNMDNFILSRFNNIKCNLKTRKKVGKLEFNITPEYIQTLYNKNHFCKLTGSDLTYNPKVKLSDNILSIDRIDSNKGYIENNIQLVHKDVNMMKGSLTQERFIELCKMVASHNK